MVVLYLYGLFSEYVVDLSGSRSMYINEKEALSANRQMK